VRLDLILNLIGFQAEASQLAWKGIIFLIPYIYIQNFNENLRSYMIVQGFDRVFFITNMIEILVGTFLAWLFVWELKLGIIGIGVSRGITEAITSVVLLVGWKMYGMEKSYYKGETLGQMFCAKETVGFFRFFAQMIFPVWAKCVAYEMMTIWAGMWGNINLVAAWGVVQSFSTLCVAPGSGWAATASVYVGYQIGKGTNKFAKKLALWSVALCWIGMAWLPLSLVLFHDYITDWFTQDPEVHSILTRYL
jgi:Na+-driven multidrug efflux pump